MGILFTLLLVLHVIVCLFIILLVLVQNDKGGGLAGAFGGMGGGAAFTGSSTVTILTKITQWAGGVAFVVLLLLNYQGMKANRSVQNESELKGARKGLSTVLPPAPTGAPSIPGLGGGAGAPPSIPGLGGGAPEGAPAGSGN